MLLIGDIGATKTDLAVVASVAEARRPRARRRFRSADYGSLAALVREFLAHVGESVTHACFDVAGPVVDGCARLTNLPWDVSAQRLQRDLALGEVSVINDLAAIAHSIPLLQPDDLYTLNAGDPVARGALAVIAPGTGLGEAFLVWDGAGYRGYPSEGGHADFAPTTPEQVELLGYLQRRFDHVSYERVCSGLGIPYLYEFFRDGARAPEAGELATQLAAAEDRTPLIVAGALRAGAPDALCAAALDAFVAILGAEAGNLALKVLATGGVYVGGGIPPRIVPMLERGSFIAAFRGKGRFAELLARSPVHVITTGDAALIGAAGFGLERAGAGAEPSR